MVIHNFIPFHRCIRYPVVAVGVLRWVDYTVSDSSYFKLTTEHTPLHLALIDEIAECHPLLHQRYFCRRGRYDLIRQVR